MSTQQTARQKFRAMMKADGIIVAPGLYDGLTATLVQRTGFKAGYMTGAGTSVAKGLPDYGLMTMTEMVANADTICAAVDIPIIADADTGYGNELNVTRTIREYERAGVAGIHIEDQGFPKKCGHLDDKEIIPLDEYVAKIRAAVAARTDPDFVLIARTDARAVIGFEEAVRRSNAALDAGADMVFLEAPQSVDELAAVPKHVKGPCLFNYVEGGKTPTIDMETAGKMGFKLAILPGFLLRRVIAACEEVLVNLHDKGELPSPTQGIGVRDIFARVGAAEWDKLRHQFAAKDAAE
ncbi:MAG: isocitrate lyase/PEP mutase family protein [Hyphomicrobiaceae bacterium]|nr:isocitrate lyase/PEP mutase family protein [Hyphomicrobiaceae bacterium]